MTHTVDGEGYRSVVRLVIVTERLGLIGFRVVQVDGPFAGRFFHSPVNAVYRSECCMAEEMSARSRKRR